MALGITVVSQTGNNQIGQPAQVAQKGGGGWLRVRVATLSGDSAYPTTGYPVSYSNFLFGSQLIGIQLMATSGSNVTWPALDVSSSTNYVIRIYGNAGNSTTPTEVASGTNLSTFTWRVMAWGM